VKISIDPVIASRIKTAWAKLLPEQRNRLIPLLTKGHQQAIVASQGRIAPPTDASIGHALPLAFSAISDDQDGIVNNLDAGIVVAVDGGGEIWGTGKYEQLDPGWLEAAAEWLEHFILGKHPFSTTPATIPIPPNVQIALAGDWGTGDWRTTANPAPSTDVLTHMTFLQPDLTIHLGDVYYAGTGSEEEHLLVKRWYKGPVGSLALNSNHEMYSGAGAYFKAINGSPFEKQQGCSYFALENNDWVIVGLDSAYYSDEETLYRDGALFPSDGGHQEQLDFLRAQVASATEGHKQVIILTHHNGLVQDGSSQTKLWSQVMSAFPADSGPAYWYWGHVHAGVVYQPQKNGAATVLCRCCGHGGLPCGQAPDMEQKERTVLWYENRLAHDPDIPLRILNGFVMLYLDGPKIEEVFYDENGGGAWRP
jgi:hypothetical protein